MKTAICPICGKTVTEFLMYRGEIVGCKYCGINVKETNADKLRYMSDEDLATWLNCMQSNAWHKGRMRASVTSYPDTNHGWLKWLKEIADE